MILMLLSMLACQSNDTGSSSVEGAIPSGVMLFSQVYDGNSVQMWSYDFEDATVESITEDNSVYWFGRWSPDAQQIGLSRQTDVYVMNSDGSSMRKIVGGNGQQIHPAWGPDGDCLVYQGHAKPDYEIYTIDIADEGAEPIALTTNDSNDYTPDWSADGQFVVMARDYGSRKHLVRLDLNSGVETRLTDLSGDSERPRISPDGKTIAFQYTINGFSSIYLMNADGSGEPWSVSESGYNLMPAWSPDNAFLAYVTELDGAIDIVVVDRDGEQVARITDDYFEERDLDWRL